MYRGSSFLHQYNHHVHVKAIRVLLKEKHSALWVMDSYKHESFIKGVEDLIGDLYLAYRERALAALEGYSEGDTHTYQPSDTLLSKVMLGTMGCIPAYDDFFRTAIGKQGTGLKSPNKKSLESLLKFIENNEHELNEAKEWVSAKPGIHCS